MENIKEQKYAYIMFSSTGTKIGKMIRFFTSEKFNHVSISFDSSMNEVWAFARKNYYTPLVGGLVREYRYRYTLGRDDDVEIKILRLPVEESRLQMAKDRVREIDEGDYSYNIYSAATFMFRHGVDRDKKYTCSEFASHIINILRPDITLSKPCCKMTPEDVLSDLKGYEFYSGKLSGYDGFYSDNGAEDFFRKYGHGERWRITYDYIKKHRTPKKKRA